VLHKGDGVQYPWLNKKIENATKLIQEWLKLTDKKVYCSISGGKDSLVTSHLIARVYPECPFVWVNQGYLAEWIDCVELINTMREQYNIVELCPVRDLWHLYIDLGLPLEGTMATKADKIINQKLIYDPLTEYQELNGITGYAWGIRKQESRGRAIYLKSHGLIHQNKKDGLIVCSPVGFWTTQEIWQYIDMFSLDYPAMYDIDRMTVRNGCPIGTTGVNWGRLSFLRLHYPKLFNEFASHFPEVNNYV